MDTISLQRQDLAPKTIKCDSEGQISGSPWSVILFEGVFGLGLLALSLRVIVLLFGRRLLFEWAMLLPFAAMFGAVGYKLLREASRTMKQWRYAFGATLELSGDSPAIGGRLTGVIRHPKLGTFNELDVVFACLREFDDRPAPSAEFNPANAVWFEQQRVKVVHDTVGGAVHVSFPISSVSTGASVFWRLEARPGLAGVVLFFDIPVFR